MQRQKTPHTNKAHQNGLTTHISKLLVAKKQAEELHTEKVPNDMEKQKLKEIWRGL